MADLQTQYLELKSEIDDATQKVFASAAFINGPQVKTFAHNLAQFLNCQTVVPCGNGTDALQIALMALDLKPGDEVILPVHTYVATAEVIALLQLKPVFVDVYPNTFNINVKQIEPVITDKTKAIVPVHLYGQCADMEPLLSIAKKYNLFVIEDTAQALGASYTFSDGTVKKSGTMGDIGCTSFFPSKNLGCYGDGGAMIFNDAQLAQKAKMIANHGQSVKYHHDVVGCNSRLDTVQAAILDIKLTHLDRYNSSRRKVADTYNKAFQNIEEIITPITNDNSTHVFHQYTVRINNRDEVKEKLLQKGIPSMIYYPIPLHKQKAYEDLKASFPISEKLSETVLSLPIYPEISQEIQDYIIQSIKEIFNS